MNSFLQNRALLALVASGFLLTAWPNAHRAFAQEEVGVSEPESDPSLVTDDLVEETADNGDLDAPSRSALSEEFQDASFARYVDLRLVGDAVDSRDASLLADVALQLAEGERILLRNHKSGLTAKKIMGKAAKLAGELQDNASLERLAKAAQAEKDGDLAAAIQAGQSLAGASRSSDPALSISLETTDVGKVVSLMGWIDSVRNAGLLGDKAELQLLREELKQADGLSDAQRAAIAKHIDRSTVGLQKADEQDAVLARLAGESRGNEPEKVDKKSQKGFPDRASAKAYSLQLLKYMVRKHGGPKSRGWSFSSGVKSYKKKNWYGSVTLYEAWAKAEWDSSSHG